MNVIRALLFDNLGLKLAALLLALLVYLNVYLDRPQSMLVSFPVQVEDLPDSLSLSGPMPSTVQAEMHGSGKQLLRLRVTEPVFKLSLEGIGPGRFERAVTSADLPVTLSEGLQVDRMVGPRTIELTVEPKVKRIIPVAPRVIGTPAAVMRWTGEVLTTPGVLEVTGPKSVVAGLDSVILQPVRIEGRRDTVSGNVMPVALPDWCTAIPAVVEVRAPLRRHVP